MVWKSGVQLQLLKSTLSYDPASLVQPCFNDVFILAAAGHVASCLLLSLQRDTEFVLGRSPRKAPSVLSLGLHPFLALLPLCPTSSFARQVSPF